MPTTDLSLSSLEPPKPTTPRPADHPAATLHEELAVELPTDAQSKVENFREVVDDQYSGNAHGFLHLPPDSTCYSRTAVILLSGAGGGVVGPSAMYLSLAQKLPLLSSGGLPVLRLDYRYPARTETCVADAKAAMAYLTAKHNIEKFVLVGWSFGGAPVFTIAGQDERVCGAATVASQTADALKGAREAGERRLPVLLLHGTGDRILSDRCSRKLHAAWLYGAKNSENVGEEAELVLFNDDDHALTKNASEASRLVAEFVLKCAGEPLKRQDEALLSVGDVSDQEVVIEAMEKGGDLRGRENVN